MSYVNIAAEYRLIEQHIALLKERVLASEATACVYEFPPLLSTDIGVQPKHIALNRIEGDRALALALLHLSDARVTNDMPGLFGRRLAGTVIIQTKDGKDIVDRIKVINNLKDQFQKSILALDKNIDKRFEMFRDALPNVSKKAATRHILIAGDDTKAINFSWTHRYSGKTFTREELAKKLMNSAKRFSTQIDSASGESIIDMEITALNNANHTNVFYQRRPLRVTPTAHIYNYALAQGKNVVAHSPIFIINQFPIIGDFHDYPQRERTSKVNDLMLVIDRLHIYCEKP